jgi:hypothetical protein
VRTFALVHSPLVGPMTWERVAEVLQREESTATIVTSGPILSDTPPPYYEGMTRAVAAEIDSSARSAAVGLVLHSGAGALGPSVAAALEAPLAGTVFVDALLPHPGRSWFETAPVELAAALRGMARQGRLPRWNEWFPPDALQALVPDDDLRTRLIAELQPVSVGYLEERAPTVGMDLDRCGYIRLSEGYDAEASEAQRLGWPTLTADLHHLAMLTHPAEVSALIVAMTKELDGRSYAD